MNAPTPEQIRANCPQGSASFLRLNGLLPGLDVAPQSPAPAVKILPSGKKVIVVTKPKKTREQRKATATADSLRFYALCQSAGIPRPVSEYRFHESRKWRFDHCWPLQRVAIEIQGGIFIAGRHSRGAALLKEWEKLNAAAVAGWRILYCQPKDLCSEETIKSIAGALAQGKDIPNSSLQSLGITF